MRLFSLIFVSLFLISGCGSGGGSDSVQNSVSNSGSGISNSGDFNGTPSTPDEGSGSIQDPVNSGNGDSSPAPAPITGFEQEMLTAVNAARAAGYDCGGTFMPAVGPLTWDADLEQAAFVHSSNMANYNFFSHTGQDGLSVSDRVTNQGYSWRAVGENIAAGQKDVNAVMTGWLNSPGHCKNIMSANFTQMGASFVTNSSTQYGIYWTQVFAAPRN
ncbi:CAP domain-containing protein [Photobacterium lipolyticum]|uniref:CAP domain-containing protein n=1 Tax=Photobacterium lipolyticum TaxID=266810 RepID=A0A2T3MZR1_9GAMM|nr:CAP domain-containing protein [Photobacterium lipolyticum]PSW05439.1 CAP domain-containing protein [Photobacterium lipolyticum]